MQIFLRKQFEKDLKKLSPKIYQQFRKRFDLFVIDPFYPLLNNHILKGDYVGFRSININGDVRVIYIEKDGDIYFLSIGTHSELYE